MRDPDNGIVQAVQYANLAIRFLLELGALAALAFWGVRTGNGIVASAVLGVGAPALAAVLWGAFVSPKARFVVPEWVRLLVQLVVFGGASLGLAHAGEPALALGYAAVALASTTLFYAWGQQRRRA